MGIAEGTVYRIVVISALGVGVGALASLGAIAFVDAFDWLNRALLVSPYTRIQYEEHPHLVNAATVLVPTLGGLVVGVMVHTMVREKRALGPADSILAVQTRETEPSLRSGVGSTLAALVSLGCGASVGQYGPQVYLGTLIGQAASRIDLRIADLKVIGIGCGVAAAISTAFNAPIAGIVFVHEVILRYFSLRAFAPITVASATGYVVSTVVFAREPLFLVEFEGVRHSYEFLLFAVEGIGAAFLAAGFMALLLASARLAKRMPLPAVARPMAAGLVLGVVALWVPEVLGIGRETLRFATIEGAFAFDTVALILVAKILMTALCIGFGFVGGVFSPSLVIGSLFGAIFGMTLPLLAPFDISGIVVYAICGMMAVTSPVIGAPLTTILIVFELTRNYDLTIAAMVSVVFANLVAFRIFGRSLFDVQLGMRGFDLSFGRDKAILGTRWVVDHVSNDCSTFGPDERVSALLRRLQSDGRGEGVVVNEEGRFLGIVRLQDAIRRDEDWRVGDIAVGDGVRFDETTTIWEAFERLQGFVGEAVPVVRRADERLLGVVPEGAVIGAYLEAMQELRREENEGV